VLHHLPDPEAGFRTLVGLLDQDGMMLLYLYSRSERTDFRSFGLGVADRLRKASLSIPHPLLRTLSAPVAAALYAGVVVPGDLGARLGIRQLAGLPLHTYRRKPLRSLWLDTFDRLSAPLERRYVWSELEPWFAAAGMKVEAVREDAGLYIVARKASTTAS